MFEKRKILHLLASILRDPKKRVFAILSIIFIIIIMSYSNLSLLREENFENLISNDNYSKSIYKTDIPKTRYNSLKDINEHDNSINTKYCGTEDCKFLVAYYPFLQENKLCDNYIDYINLARLLNRVMVLTNVGPTRISTCQKFPFNFYYDVNSLSQRFPDVKFISQLEFQKWTELRYRKPTVSHVFITNGGLNNSIEDIIPYANTLKRIWCLDKFNLKFDKHSKFKQISASRNNWEKTQNNNDFISFLKSNLQFTEDVLLIRHDIRNSLFLVGKNEQMNYAKHITDAAEMIINRLRPYIAVQWILEHANENHLNSCADRLLERVQSTIRKSKIKNIYMATDYPLFEIIPDSNNNSNINDDNNNNNNNMHVSSLSLKSYSPTWKYVTKVHYSAMEKLKSTFPLANWESKEVIDNLEDAFKNQLINAKEIKGEIINTGINRIIDRIICVKAELFVGLPKNNCSTKFDIPYISEIVNERAELMTKMTKNIRNNVARF
ncbi:hypothetical protein Glove_306g86 [Diversispora epigaea]|uniref:Uncharacterized protein n=1 Tax=Diversispora epigaea TaxID=1348612 RepID=A0A397HZZ0_9GLOM|nr:hypothetical protein Glove_306g86 [Diversispora epigaea]